MGWNPRTLSPYVTNLELWSLMVIGFVLGRWGDGFGAWPYLALLFGAFPAVHWWRGHCGLDQWPNPYGRYYMEWLALKGGGDYYPWLVSRLGNRPPWNEWAEREKEPQYR